MDEEMDETEAVPQVVMISKLTFLRFVFSLKSVWLLRKSEEKKEKRKTKRKKKEKVYLACYLSIRFRKKKK